MFATLIGAYPPRSRSRATRPGSSGCCRGAGAAGLANASSLGGLTRERARVKVEVLVTAARLAATASPDELAAALGRYTPKPK